ncbi:MAG TPA: hypothetical protein PK078_07030 [Anaerolineales bacterium]|nr:hypothetical protein [Anaerolineales bacterium]HNB36684.1 hypothetical protein [Anaerolineales bacterium]
MSENDRSNTVQAGEPPVQPMLRSEFQRYQTFVWIQIFFLGVSVITGGFNFKVWSMLDSSILIVSIGVSSLLFVLDDTKVRKLIFNTSMVLYLLGVLDMAANILISGSVGWYN